MIAGEFEESGAVSVLEEIREHSEALADALPPFIEMYDRLYSQAQKELDDKVPDDYEFRSNVQFDPLNRFYVLYKAWQGLGGEPVIVGPEADRDNKICMASQAAVYVSPKLEYWFTELPYQEPGAGLLFSALETNSVPRTYVLNPQAKFSWYQSEKLAPLVETDL